jgi:hypothetical protein
MERQAVHMDHLRQGCTEVEPALSTMEIAHKYHEPPHGSPSTSNVRQMLMKEVRSGNAHVLLKDDLYFPHGDLTTWHAELLARSMTAQDAFIDWPKWQLVLTKPAVSWLEAKGKYVSDSAGYPRQSQPKHKLTGREKRSSVLRLTADMPRVDPRKCTLRTGAEPSLHQMQPSTTTDNLTNAAGGTA